MDKQTSRETTKRTARGFNNFILANNVKIKRVDMRWGSKRIIDYINSNLRMLKKLRDEKRAKANMKAPHTIHDSGEVARLAWRTSLDYNKQANITIGMIPVSDVDWNTVGIDSVKLALDAGDVFGKTMRVSSHSLEGDGAKVLLVGNYTLTTIDGLIPVMMKMAAAYSKSMMVIETFPGAKPLSNVDLELFESSNLNCVLKCMIQHVNKKFDEKKAKPMIDTITKYADDHGLNTGDKPVTNAILNEILKKCRLRVRTKSMFGGVIHDSDPEGKQKRSIVELYAHNNHASLYVELDKRPSEVSYIDDFTDVMSTHQPFEIMRKRIKGEYFTTAVKMGDTIYKKAFPMDEGDDTMKCYFSCVDESQYRYKKWKMDNNLRALTGTHFKIAKEADHHLSRQSFREYDDKLIAHSYDISKAYPSFKTSPYYEQFKFGVGHFDIFKHEYRLEYHTIRGGKKCSDVDLDVIDKTGFSRVSDIEFIGSEGEFIEKVNYIKENCWFNHITLFHIASKGWARFNISHTMMCYSPEDLIFPWETSTQNKLVNNTFIGRLIAGASNGLVSRTYCCSDPDEMGFLAHEIETKFDTVPILENDTGYFNVYYPTIQNDNQLHQIRSSIISYSDAKMIDCMVEHIDHIIAYNVDGFFTDEDISLFSTTTMCSPKDKPEEKFGKFVYEGVKAINWASNMEAPGFEHDNFALPQMPLYGDYKGLHSVMSLVTGPAGCGKSYTYMCENPRAECGFLFPTNKLVADSERKSSKTAKCLIPDFFEAYTTFEEKDVEYNRYIATYHKYFGIGVSFHKPFNMENVIIDEVSLIAIPHLDLIVKMCADNRTNVHFIGDINKEGIYTYQRGPVAEPDQMPTCDRWGPRKEWQPEDTKPEFRRQPNPDHWDFIQSLRNNKTSLENLEAVRSKCKSITKEDMYKRWDANWIGISSRHKNINIYNNAIQKARGTLACRARSLKTIVNKEGKYISINGQLADRLVTDVYFGRTSAGKCSHKFKYEAAYFITSDLIQGTSLDEIIVIDPTEMLSGFLYTAISRCRNLDNVYIINEFCDN